MPSFSVPLRSTSNEGKNIIPNFDFIFYLKWVTSIYNAETRIINDYGHIDNETPSLAISLFKEYRSLGIGTALMNRMIELLKSKGYKRVSLSVQKENYAYNLYKKVGFEIIKANDEDFIMVKQL